MSGRRIIVRRVPFIQLGDEWLIDARGSYG